MRRDHYHEEIGSEILIIGGAEDKLNERHILRKFVDISGGRNASLLIVPVPSDFPLVTATLYKGLFENLGINSNTRFDIQTGDNKNQCEILTGWCDRCIPNGRRSDETLFADWRN